MLSNDHRWAWLENIKHTLSRKVYEQLLKDIAKVNDDLHYITRQSILLEPYRQKRRSKQLTIGLKTVREHATSIYRTFIRGKGWNCHCTIHHIARLRLETRFVSLKKENAKVTSSAQFTILLAQRRKEMPQPIAQYQAVEISSSFDKKTDEIVRNDSNTKLRTVKFASSPVLSRQDCRSSETSLNEERKLILDFCSKLYAARNPDNAVGFVVDEENERHTHHFTLVDPIISNEAQMKSLNDLLSCSERESRKNYLSRGGRLRIAVILASSILQLHGTPWLKAQWTCKDVYFLERNISGNGQGHVYPYLPWKLCKDDSNFLVSTVDQKQPARCEILFALGQVLVELCFGKPLTELCAPEDDMQDEETLMTTTAQRLLDEVDREMGDSYGDVVRRCLRPPFDVRVMSFENEELQHLVFDKIVTPLSNDLDHFEGRI